MSYTRTLLQLRTAVQINGQYENSTDITTTVLNDYINRSILEGYQLIVAKWEDYYTILGTTISVVANTDSYALPTDFYKLRKLEIQTTNGRWTKLLPHDLDSSHTFRTIINRRYRYRLQGGNIVLVPTPTGPETIRPYYIPTAPQLAADGDTITFDVPQEETLIVDLTLRRCFRREDLPTNDINAQIAEDVANLRSAADARDAGEPFCLNPRGPDRDVDDWEDDY